MANEWLRLWHDTPNDPKFRSISKASGQSLSLVQAVFMHLLVDASKNPVRGRISVSSEDLASALDSEEERIQTILDAMEGRVIDGDRLTGWERRQPKREDYSDPETGKRSSAERKRTLRAKKQDTHDPAVSHSVPQRPAMSRNVPPDKDTDTDTDTDSTTVVVESAPPRALQRGAQRMTPHWRPSADTVTRLGQHNIPKSFAEDLVPEFVLYWAERGTTALAWQNKFYQHAIRKWREYEAIGDDRPPERMPQDWAPSEQAIEALAAAGVDALFAEAVLPEFVIYWHESNRVCASWNAKFIQHVQQRWSQRLNPQQLTRDIPIEDQLNDRSWAQEPKLVKK